MLDLQGHLRDADADDDPPPDQPHDSSEAPTLYTSSAPTAASLRLEFLAADSQDSQQLLMLPPHLATPRRPSTGAFPWPGGFAEDVLQYLRTLQWPPGSFEDENDVPGGKCSKLARDGVSWLELAPVFAVAASAQK
jgi:hypothetical protein